MRKIIISAAGSGKRFIEYGINTPKYKIIANKKSLIYWALISLKNFFKYEFIFIFRKNNYEENFIKSELQELGIVNYKIILLDHETSGQATTIFLAQDLLNDDDEILIYNVDTHINYRSLNEDIFQNDGCIVTTNVPGNNWSFARVENGKVIEVSEKIKISDHASVGLYYFKKWIDFKNIFIKHQKDIINKYKEVYVCPMYQYLINDNKIVKIFEINNKDFVCLGTPQEVNLFDPKWEINNK